MDKKSKEALRRYKKARMAARQRSESSDSSSSSDSDSYSSCSGSDRHRKKKTRRSSSSDEERRKREKREHCQKKLEAKRNHLKRKLKEAKLKKRAAVAAAVLNGHSHRSLSPNTQAKLKKLAERKHLRAQSKERREREREKHRAAAREREREQRRSHSPTKIRIHQDIKRQKSPPRMHQMMSREKIIIQARTRSHTPSAERDRHEQKVRQDLVLARERRDREKARDKERAEALARCQERQRERERVAREKLRREEEEKKYGGERGERLIARTGDRELPYNSRERSLESDRGRHMSKRELDVVYERDRDYVDVERRGVLDRDELRREREYIAERRRDLSPTGVPYAGRMRDAREVYEDERAYGGRPYVEDARHARERDAGWLPREMRDPREFTREIGHDIRYAEERERELLMRDRTLAARGDWKTTWAESPSRSTDRNWEETAAPHATRSGFVGGPKRGGGNASAKIPATATREQRANSEPDWDTNEPEDSTGKTEGARDGHGAQRDPWIEHDVRDSPREKPLQVGRQAELIERRWPGDWRESEDGRLIAEGGGLIPLHHHRAERGGRGGFRHGFRGPPPLMTLPVQAPGVFGGTPRFPNKRNMTYTNPTLIKKQQVLAAKAAQQSVVAAATTAVAAAKAAAQSAANATTNPGILGQVTSKISAADANEKPEAGEILPEHEENEIAAALSSEPKLENATAKTTVVCEDTKASGELSEISDSDDEILNNAERKSKSELEDTAMTCDVPKPEINAGEEKIDESISVELERANDEDEMLDFEEISDGELEEEARHKGVGDALGVDWASLIAETKMQAENAAQPSAEQPTTAKQKWQPHRIILDIGISMRMAGEEYAKRVISDAQQKLQDELQSLNKVKIEIKNEIKEEISTPPAAVDDDDSQATTTTTTTTAPLMDADAENTTNSENEKKFDIEKIEIKSGEEKEISTSSTSIEPSNTLNVESLNSLACVQVAQRNRLLEQRQLFANACGPNSRALSARRDLKLRRQLCGLPAEEPQLPIPIPAVSANLKSMALEAFKRTMEVK